MKANPVPSRKINNDGSVYEYLLINGDRVTLHFAPELERESSAEALARVREILFQEYADSGKLVNLRND